mgnify:CR=1 FL=1
MKKLVEEIIKPILENNPKIKKVVGIYGGRFQPFGPHHYKTYKWLDKQVDDAYITTSNIKKPPRHPMNYKEKVRHMTKMGVPSNRIIVEKTPYVAINALKKYDKDTTAVVYIFGKKDAGRLTGGTKKSGGKTYYQDFKKNKKDLKGYEEHGYILTAPHVSISVGGKEVSGTSMRELLGSSKIDDKERAKLFKKMFGYFDKGVFNMLTNKFKKLFKEDVDMEFKPTSMYYVPSNKKKLKPKFKDGKGKELIKGWLEEGVPPKVKKALGKYVPNKIISNNTKLIAWIQKNPMLINQLLRLATEGKLDEDFGLTLPDGTINGAPRAKKVKKTRKKWEKEKDFMGGKEYQYEDVDWFKKGSKKDRALKLKISKLYSKAFKMMPGSPNQKKIQKEIEKLRNQLGEDVNVVKKKGKDGGDYREYDSDSNSDWEEPYKHNIDEFLTTIDMSKIIKESSSTSVISTDDGPNIFYDELKHYQTNTEDIAAKLGWGVINYLIDGEFKTDEYPIYPNGPVGSVSFLPAGAGGKVSPNNQADLVGTESWNAWVKHISNVAQKVGYELINFVKDTKDEKDAVVKDTKKTKDVGTKETPPETKHKIKVENTFTKDWWKEIITEEEMLLDEGVKFNNFLKGWAKKTKQPEEKVKKAMNNKNTFSIAKLNNFSVDDVLENSKKGYNAVANVIKYLPKKAAEKINNTKAGEKKDKLLKKADDWLKKHPKTKRAVMLGAAGAVTYMWTQMTFIGEPEYDFDLSGVAGAASGTATLSDLFGGTQGTKFLGLFATAKATGLSFPYPGKNLAKFAVGITYGAYKLKKHKDKQRATDLVGSEDKLASLPQKVANPNPSGWRKTVNVNSAISWVSKNKGPGKAKKYVRSLRKQKEESFTKDWWKKELLNEGGAYGHMAHPFDDKDLTFGDLKKIIEDGLGGTLSREDGVTEKLDGQNIMISWKDGKLIAARNKGHIKNGGKTALDTKGIISKFKGRGDIRNAFVYAMKDLEKAIKTLSQKQKDKIFNEGQHWMNLEVMWPASANVIDYDKAELVFHGALIYDDNGTVKGEVKGSGRILAGMIKQRNQNIQKKYKIGKPVFLEVPKHQDFGAKKDKFIGKLNKLKSTYALKDKDTLALYHQSYWEEYIYNASQQFGYTIPNKILENLTKRWAFFDKSYKIPTIRTDLKEQPEFLEWVLKTDKEDHTKMVKENMKPFETLFFEVGAEILKNVKGFMAANPDKAVQGIRKRLNAAISNVKAGGDKKKLNTLKLQLDKLNKIGGVDAIVPSEGIVFKYKGKTYKFTGAFAPINQITGLMSF